MKTLLPLVLAVACWNLSSAYCQDQPPRDEARVARLIRDLGADVHRVRQTAGEELARIGSGSREQLELATQSTDPEVRLRANDLLRRLKIDDLWAPSIVHYSASQEPAAGVLTLLARRSGNQLLVGKPDLGFNDAKVELDGSALGFWQAVDSVNRQAENYIRPNYDARQPRLAIVAGPPGQYPVAYSGPLRAQVTSALREYSETFDYEHLKSRETHTFAIDMQVIWEDRFRLMAFRAEPELVEAVTDTEDELSSTSFPTSTWHVAASSTRQLTAKLRLSPPPITAKKLDRLAVDWDLIAVGDPATIEVSSFESRQAHRQDDLELTIESFEALDGGRFDVTLVISRDMAIPEPRDILFEENRLELLDAGGKPFRQYSQSNLLTDAGAKLRITFIGESADSVPTLLRVTYPRIRAQRTLRIVFHDVPLPTSRPE